MLRAVLAIVALAAFATACVDSPADERTLSDGPIYGLRTLRADDAQATTSAAQEGENPPDACAQLLDTEGPCVLACDPNASLEDWVPPHTCVALVCPLTDGSHATLHACRAD